MPTVSLYQLEIRRRIHPNHDYYQHSADGKCVNSYVYETIGVHNILVLTRSPGQSLTITTETGKVVKIYILESRAYSRQMRIGIEGPKDITILRSELVEKAHTHKAN